MKKKGKIILFSIITLVIFLVGFMVIFNSRENISLESEEYVFEYGEKVCSKVECYLKDASSTKNINEYELDIKDLIIKDDKLVSKESEYLNVGEYKLTVKNKENQKDITIKITDTTSPEFIEFNDSIILEQNSVDIDLTSFFSASDLSDVKIKVEGEVNLSKVGEYSAKVIATDSYNNFSEKETIIKVVDLETAKKDGIVSKNLKGEIYKSAAMIEYENNKNKPTNNSQNNSTKKPSTSTNSNNKPTSGNSSNNSNNSSNNASTSKFHKDISDSYFSQINAYRKSRGLAELPVTPEAQAEADRRAKEISVNYSHDGSGYGFGENIGNGGIGSDFFTAWKNSPSHHAAMIREEIVAMAVSVYEVNGMWYAVTVFRMNY